MNNLSENINKTFELLNNSYCPYSKFRVASSIITKDNDFFGGTNIENASYGLTMCAERTAIFNMLSSGISKDNINYIIIVSDCSDKIIPCGACLQVFSEFLEENTQIYIACFNKLKGQQYKINEYKFKNLLPIAFNFDTK